MTNSPLIDGIEHLPEVGLATWVRFQLGSRHYPPVRPENDAAAIEAIEKAAADNWDHEVTLWNGRVLTAGEIVTDLHLEPLVDFYIESLAEAEN